MADRSLRPIRRARSALLRWYRENRRDLPWRRTRDPYAIWVSEAMLQQTRVAAALRYYERFLEAFPGVVELAEAPEEEVLGAWSGLGYYRRASALRAGARAVVERHGGHVPSDPAELRALPGIGPYTAGAIASIAFGLAEPVVDGNVRRVLSRLLALRGTGAREARSLELVARELVRGKDPGDFNQALMELGALVCAPRAPRCGDCVLASVCRGRASGDPAAFPRAVRGRPAAVVGVAAVVLEHRGRILLVRHDPATPLRGAWDVPATVVPDEGNPRGSIRGLLARLGVRVRLGGEVARVRHSILDRRLVVQIFSGRVARRAGAAADRVRWIRPADLRSAAVSGATGKIVAAAGLTAAEPRVPAGQNRSHGGTQSSPRLAPRRETGSGSRARAKR